MIYEREGGEMIRNRRGNEVIKCRRITNWGKETV